MARSTTYNTIVTDELLEQVDKRNLNLMDEWLEYLSSTDKSHNTIYQYHNDLKIFWCWNLLENKNKFFTEFKKKDVMRFQNYLLTKLGHSSDRIRRLRGTLSSLSNYIERILDEEEDFKGFRNIINKVPAPSKNAAREKTILQEEDVQLILDKLVEQKQYQIACMFALASYGGARKSELTRFKVNYFDDENIVGGLYKTPETIVSKGRGSKGKAIYKYTIAKYFKPYLDLWLNQRNELGIDSEWLFINKKDDVWVQIETPKVDGWAKKIGRIINMDFYWHSLRHYFTTSLVKAGIPAEVIRKIVSWDSVSMIGIYNDSSIDDELDKYFSFEGVIAQEDKDINNL